MKKIEFFDTTLRDGEQTPGVNFNTTEKVELAKQLERWGVDVIEAGFPVTSQGDFEAIQAISRSLKKARVGGLARCVKRDIDVAYEALKDAPNKQIHVFIATSPIHREYKLNMTKEEVLDRVKEYVAYAKTLFEHVQFSPEDATRTEWDYLAEVVEAAIQAGATVINIPDTVGYTNPTEYGNLFKYLKEHVPSFDQAIFSSHCHNDLGMAVANALASIENGALRVEGTVNGIGERAGNTALEEVAVILKIREQYYQAESNINLKETKRTSSLVSRLSGMIVPKNKAVVGGNAFAHESGIHQDGVLKNPETYEIITPQMVGVETNELPLGKLSGRHAFIDRMESLGYDTSDPKLIDELFNNFKDLADRKQHITNSDLHAIMLGKVAEEAARYELRRLQVLQINDYEHVATVVINEKDNTEAVKQDSGTGPGSVEAIYSTINKILETDYKLLEYSIEAITAGSDSQAQVHVQIENPNGDKFYGMGVDSDVLAASAKAYLQAIR